MAPKKRQIRKVSGADVTRCPKRSRLELNKSVNLLDLPVGPLHLIISKVTPSAQKFLRCASTQLRVEHSDCMLHNYKSFANLHLRNLAASEGQTMVRFVIQVLAQSTDYFINSGFDAVFTGRLLHFYKQLTTGEEEIDVVQMHQFLHDFYYNIEWSSYECPMGAAARVHLNQRRLIHTMTLLNLLRQFRKFRVVSSGMNLLHWHLQLEVPGIHYSARNKDFQPKEEDKLIDFMTIIAELLVFDKSQNNVSRYIDIGSTTYVYGLKDQPQSAHSPKLNIKFSMLAPLALRNLLEDILYGNVEMSSGVQCPLVNTLSINMELKSRPPKLWDGSDSMDICIVPLH